MGFITSIQGLFKVCEPIPDYYNQKAVWSP